MEALLESQKQSILKQHQLGTEVENVKRYMGSLLGYVNNDSKAKQQNNQVQMVKKLTETLIEKEKEFLEVKAKLDEMEKLVQKTQRTDKNKEEELERVQGQKNIIDTLIRHIVSRTRIPALIALTYDYLDKLHGLADCTAGFEEIVNYMANYTVSCFDPDTIG